MDHSRRGVRAESNEKLNLAISSLLSACVDSKYANPLNDLTALFAKDWRAKTMNIVEGQTPS